MDDLMMEFDYDAGLAQGNMGMEVDKDELMHDSFIGGQKCQHPHLPSTPPNPTLIPPKKPSTPITDNCSAFCTRPTAVAHGCATPGPVSHLAPQAGAMQHHSHSASAGSSTPFGSSGMSTTSTTQLTLCSTGNLAKHAKTSSAGHHIQTILNKADTVHKDKVIALELKNNCLCIKLDHEHHHNEQAFAHEEWTSEQANAVILHQYQTEKLEAEICLQDEEART
ncbi:hypothetical protein PAXRUDRAFT_15301 [Paxillus rubicundulus Ve08.2h10]|uniref:Uncharacterized protein n=1 Tax=Paxillus rubicundulus Ve08.2h10 TaxID=930991 RepID=A0A0D0CF03_9AGAM|nr:hypothetical protein PAXRUDRAFT_15301 [Paxillus rubicundulus Ve08.2h10]